MFISELDKNKIKFPDSWKIETILDFERFVKKYVSFANSLFEDGDEKGDNSIINIDLDSRTFKLSNYCGEIIFNNTIFHIYPFSFDEDFIEKEPSKSFSLFYENINLYLEDFFKVRFVKLKNLINKKDDDLLEILISIFINELELKLQNKPYYSYIDCEDSLTKLVGKLNFDEYIKNYVNGKKHLLICDYSLFSFDNSINKIIKFTLNKLIKVARNLNNINRLKRLFVLFDKVSDITRKDVERFYNNLSFNQLNKDYENLILLSKILINGLNSKDSNSYASKNKNINFCFLFKMNVLFERFISARLNDYLKSKFEKEGFKSFTQTKKKKLFVDLNKFPLKPDNLIKGQDYNTIAIIDTKYKVLDNFDISNSSNSDLYQMSVYNLIYKSKIGILMYPLQMKEEKKFVESLDFKTLNNSDPNFVSKVAVISAPIIFKEEEIKKRDFSRLYKYFDLIFKL